MKVGDDPKRMQFLNDALAVAIDMCPEAKQLHDRLLAVGGKMTLIRPPFADVPAILLRGDGWGPTARHLRRSSRKYVSDCHFGSAETWSKSPTKYRIATGYALTDDELWRQHSWLVDNQNEAVEVTPVLRVRYFGFVLNLDEATEFAIANGPARCNPVFSRGNSDRIYDVNHGPSRIEFAEIARIGAQGEAAGRVDLDHSRRVRPGGFAQIAITP